MLYRLSVTPSWSFDHRLTSAPSSRRSWIVPPRLKSPTIPFSRLPAIQASHVASAEPSPPPKPSQKPRRTCGFEAGEATEGEATYDTADNEHTTSHRPRMNPPPHSWVRSGGAG